MRWRVGFIQGNRYFTKIRVILNPHFPGKRDYLMQGPDLVPGVCEPGESEKDILFGIRGILPGSG
jgi:hypothetical protein